MARRVKRSSTVKHHAKKKIHKKVSSKAKKHLKVEIKVHHKY